VLIVIGRHNIRNKKLDPAETKLGLNLAIRTGRISMMAICASNYVLITLDKNNGTYLTWINIDTFTAVLVFQCHCYGDIAAQRILGRGSWKQRWLRLVATTCATKIDPAGENWVQV